MAETATDTSIWLGLEAPDGLLYTMEELTADRALLESCAPGAGTEGGLVFSDLDETIVASGPFFSLGQSLLIDAPARLRAGEPVHHEPYEGDSPVDLTVQDGTLTIREPNRDITIAMPLDEALAALDAQAAAFDAFTQLLAEM